jgi:hypothetical protein
MAPGRRYEHFAFWFLLGCMIVGILLVGSFAVWALLMRHVGEWAAWLFVGLVIAGLMALLWKSGA